MRDDLREVLFHAAVPLLPGMQTDHGRVVAVGEETATVFDGTGLVEVDASVPLPNLEDPATYWVCLGFLCGRTGLDPQDGFLWYLSDDGDACWVLEGTDEVRTRDADTDDPLLSLARGLVETAENGEE